MPSVGICFAGFYPNRCSCGVAPLLRGFRLDDLTSTNCQYCFAFATLANDAVRILHERNPEVIVDGEMQVDAAVVEDLLKKRYPFSRLNGPANVLIFPDLNSANTGYKLLMRLGGAQAIGPILVGMNRPVHVLQRIVAFLRCGIQEVANLVHER